MSEKSESILNREVFFNDPTTYSLPNDGVTKVGPLPEDKSDKQWFVARYELEHFVCEGSYHEGLAKILRSFLEHLDQLSQPAVWVSGFFGSGKSHLVRVLELLWSDIRFSDGATARGLCHLPEDVIASLKELTTEARRSGGIWSAAGTLSSGDSDDPRLAVLQVVLRSAGLPDNVDIARVHLWLAQEGLLDELRRKLREIDREKDIERPFVSDHFVNILLELKPEFATSPLQAKEFLNNQFKKTRQITNDELINLMNDIFLLKSTTKGKLPLVLLVLDEVQQYLTIGEGSKQLLAFQEIIEDCCKKFGGKLLVVATGQEALQANVLLQRLQGRFSLKVSLESKDVDVVLHQTVLRKKETMRRPLQQVLDSVNGEISRHLAGTRIAHSLEDDQNLVLDYPLLPTRKRLWDSILHAVDTGGLSTQLRTQLRLAYEGAKTTALFPIGTVIPADFIFNQLNTYLIRNGLLASEINEMIRRENDGTSEGELKSRICALIFLIQHIDESYGILANAETLADLLVTDLTKGSDALRKQIPRFLDDLNRRGIISDVGNRVYRIQTKEGKAWDGEYQKKLADYKADDSKILFERDRLFKEEIEKRLGTISILHGKSKTPRHIHLTIFGSQKPDIGSKVPIWVRHGWEIQESHVQSEALEEGPESPLIMVFLPRKHHNELKNEIAGMLAAKNVIETRPTPTTSEGNQAKHNIEVKCQNHLQNIKNYIDDIFHNAKMFPAGGTPVDCPDLEKAVKEGAENAVIRLYPRFEEADASGWDRVIAKVRADSKSPLEAIGFSRPTEEHPVCREILTRLHQGSKTGNELRNIFENPPYGWPRDAIDGAIIALCALNHLKAVLQHKEIPAKEIDRKNLGKMIFSTETIVLTTEDKIALRGLCSMLKIPSEKRSEAETARIFVEALYNLATSTGGESPLPEHDIPGYLTELQTLSGNSLVKSLVERQEEIKRNIESWKQTVKLIERRKTPWDQLTLLIDHADGLPSFEDIKEQYDAIKEQRSLLVDPDPVPPLLNALRNDLRRAITEGISQITDAQDRILEELEGDEFWKKLEKSYQDSLMKKYHLIPISSVNLGTDEAIIAEIKKRPLNSFTPLVRAIEGCLPDLRSEIAKILEPKTVTVSLKSGVIVKNEKELDDYLSEVRERAKDELDKGNPVMLK